MEFSNVPLLSQPSDPFVDSLEQVFCENPVVGMAHLSAVRSADGQNGQPIVDFRFQQINRMAAHLLLQATPEWIKGKLLSEVYPPHNTTSMVDDYLAVIETGQAYHRQRFIAQFDCWVNTTCSKLSDGVLLTFTDITAVKQLEETQAKQAIFVQTVLDNVTCGVVVGTAVRGANGQIVDILMTAVNQRAATMAGHSVAAMVNERFLVLYPGLRTPVFDLYVRTIETGESQELDIHHDTGGLSSWANLQTTKLDDGLIITWTDISARKEAERQVREREQQFRMLAELVDDVHWIRSATEPTFSYINPSYERLTGRTAESLYENPFAFLDCLHPDDRLRMQSVFTSIDSYAGTYQFRVMGPSGQIHWMEAKTFLVRDELGRALYRTGVAKDITLMREREGFLQQALAQEQALSQRKSTFITTASHEFRTPLTTINSSAELVQYYLQQDAERPSTPLISRHINLIMANVASLDVLISDTLTVSKLEEQKIEVHWALTDLQTFCLGLVEGTFGDRADQRQVVMEVIGTPVAVKTDKKLLSHALTNLLSNAFKFSPTNPVLRLAFDPASVRLSVIDEGIGIPEKDMPHLFNRFFRAQNASDFKGTGLGLVICREYINLLNGQLEVESTGGKGSCFTIALAVVKSDKNS